MPDYLYQAAQVWKRLCLIQYELVYGKKKSLYEINLSFDPTEFYHLAGFQYLKDLSLLKMSSKKMLEAVINRKITQQQVEHGQQYKDMVEPRLIALIYLEQCLDSDFLLYTYRKDFYSFYTSIAADYLIASETPLSSFAFIIKDGGNMRCDFVCCSTFAEGKRNYRQNQRQCSLLKKVKVNKATGERAVLMDNFAKETASANI